MIRFLYTILFCFVSINTVQAQESLASLFLDTVLIGEGLSIPWDIEWAGNDQIIFTEKTGAISQLDINNGNITLLYEVPDVAIELQSGLMGLALAPNFPNNPKVYTVHTYYDGNDQLFLRLLELNYDETVPALSFSRILVEGIPSGPSTLGSRIVVTDKEIFLTVGDLDQSDPAQDLNDLSGKIHRYDLNGNIPTDNPFSGSPIYSYGHRNPQGLTLASNGRLYSSEHGTFSRDELNVIEAGRNYGWPIVSGMCNQSNHQLCDQYDVYSPIRHWTPTIAPSGLVFYSGDKFPQLENTVLIAGLKDASVIGVKLHSEGLEAIERKTFLKNKIGRIRDITISPSGRIFVCSSNVDTYGQAATGSDKIYELIEGEADGPIEEEPILENFSIQLDSTILEVSVIAKNLKIPWDMVYGNDGYVWFSERDGHIKRFNLNNANIQTVFKIPDVYESWDNSGLHALALHPRFPEVPYLYVHYTYSYYRSKLVRYTFDCDHFTLIEPQIILDELNGHETHNGSRILITDDEIMWFCLGDAYNGNWPQEMTELNGKVLRMHLDGSVPDDNPFPNSIIYSLGHRNPQGLTFGPHNLLYSSEHGPGNDDELNIVFEGRNYGWPKVQGFCDLPSEQQVCDSANIAEPLVAWTPTLAPGGLAYYNHDAIPEWKNSLLQCFLKSYNIGQRMHQIQLSEDGLSVVETNEFFINTFGRIRDVEILQDGRVLLSTSNRETNGNNIRKFDDDKIIEIRNPAVHTDEYVFANTLDACINIYPNPVSDGQIQLFFTESLDDLTLDLLDTRGKLIKREVLETSTYTHTLNIGELAPAIYYLVVNITGERSVVRAIVVD